MTLARGLVVLGCLCLFAVPAQAQPTVQDFSNPGVTGTNYTEYGNGVISGAVMKDGPVEAPNYYRLTYSGIGNTNNMIAFDLTAPGPSSHIVVDFDFRIGGSGNHADGIGFALLPTAVYGPTGNGPGITEEAAQAQDGSIGFGLDTFNNGLPFDPDNNHVSLHYNTTTTALNYAVSLTPFGYQMHQDFLDDTNTHFDHLHMTADFTVDGVIIIIIIIIRDRSIPPDPITVFKSFLIPGVTPYEMRAAFGARTGSADDNHDIANVNIALTP
jgi:hypothetical protein